MSKSVNYSLKQQQSTIINNNNNNNNSSTIKEKTYGNYLKLDNIIKNISNESSFIIVNNCDKNKK